MCGFLGLGRAPRPPNEMPVMTTLLASICRTPVYVAQPPGELRIVMGCCAVPFRRVGSTPYPLAGWKKVCPAIRQPVSPASRFSASVRMVRNGLSILPFPVSSFPPGEAYASHSPAALVTSPNGSPSHESRPERNTAAARSTAKTRCRPLAVLCQFIYAILSSSHLCVTLEPSTPSHGAGDLP